MRTRAVLLAASVCASLCVSCGNDEPNASGDVAPSDASLDASLDVGATDLDTTDAGDAGDTAEEVTDTALPDADIEEIEATATIEQPPYATIGQLVTLDASASENAVSFLWDLADGRSFGPFDEPTLEVSWDAVARHRVTLTVLSETGDRDRETALVTVTEAPSFAPNRSGTLVVLDELNRVASLSSDAGQVSVWSGLDSGEFELVERIDVCPDARTLARFNEGWLVTCPWDDSLEFHSDSGIITHRFASGSRPYGVITIGTEVFVSLQGRGVLVTLELVDSEFVSTEYLAGMPDARDIAAAPSSESTALFVSRWRSADEGGELFSVNLGSGERTTVSLPFDDQPASDTETGGVPTYLGGLAVSPTGGLATMPCLQANIEAGLSRNGAELTHETTVRAALAQIDVAALSEAAGGRRRFDDRGFASSAAYSANGDFLFVTMRGSRTVERIDVLSDTQSGSELNVGFAPSDVAVSENGRWVFVHAELSREVVVYDAILFARTTEPYTRLITVSDEPFTAEVLRGAQLFNDSFDVRIAKDSYIACSHCHLDGEADRRTWDFTDRGEGVRNTTSLLGRAGTGHGPVHWSANFDEIQDFEHDLRGPFGGLGLMDDADFNEGSRNTTFGAPKAGLSEDLDALAAYVTSLNRVPTSPYRLHDGTLSEPAARGEVLFNAPERQCVTCHVGPELTDSALMPNGQPLLHDVGTLGATSGQRLGDELLGIDTPTLRGLWNDAPYLHDGSAWSVRAVLDRNMDDAHGVTSDLSPDELDDLAEYVLSLE
ncbi:MAG: hypothetical protein ACJAYU_001992 [Bradymonadia bacterium]|jgi:hypothetical protein